MPSTPRLNPLSILFILGVLVYALYTGYHKQAAQQGSPPGAEVPGAEGELPRRADPWQEDRTVTVGAERAPATDSSSLPVPPDGNERSEPRRRPRQRANDSLETPPVDRNRTPPAPAEAESWRDAAQSAEPSLEPGVLVGKAVRIVDGDTVDILADQRTVRLRLEGIDAPERGQPFARAARDYLADLCQGRMVHAMVLGTDRYGRAVGDVYLADVWVNGEMVRAGFAWHYRRYSDSPELEELQLRARDAGVGLWSDRDPLPPWEFRQSARPASR